MQNITNQDPGTSDDSGRASERLTTSSVAQRDADSSRDRLSDVSYPGNKLTPYLITILLINLISYSSQASSSSSSGKGYIVSVFFDI